MVWHVLQILQQMLQDFSSVSDHFTTLRSKGLSKRCGQIYFCAGNLFSLLMRYHYRFAFHKVEWSHRIQKQSQRRKCNFASFKFFTFPKKNADFRWFFSFSSLFCTVLLTVFPLKQKVRIGTIKLFWWWYATLCAIC